MTRSDASIKNLVKEIHKEAKKWDPNAGGGATHYYGQPTNKGNIGQSSNTDVMTMQHALQNLAQVVSSQINLQDVSSGDPRKEQEAKARDAFGVFLTKNYMRNTKVPGVEYDPNPKITDISQKRPDDPTRMSVVMDTMNRIGNPKKGEQFVDGVWGTRTNAAVCDAYAFASGLLDFVDDINRFATHKMQITYYDRPDLHEFATMVKANNSLSPDDKKKAALLVTQHVKAIQNMYNEVKNNILEHPAYRQFIESDTPYKTYGQKVTPQQIETLKKSFPQGFTINFGDGQTRLGVDALLSKDALIKAIQNAAPSAVQSGQLTPQSVVSQIWKQQSALLGSNPSSDPGY